MKTWKLSTLILEAIIGFFIISCSPSKITIDQLPHKVIIPQGASFLNTHDAQWINYLVVAEDKPVVNFCEQQNGKLFKNFNINGVDVEYSCIQTYSLESNLISSLNANCKSRSDRFIEASTTQMVTPENKDVLILTNAIFYCANVTNTYKANLDIHNPSSPSISSETIATPPAPEPTTSYYFPGLHGIYCPVETITEDLTYTSAITSSTNWTFVSNIRQCRFPNGVRPKTTADEGKYRNDNQVFCAILVSYDASGQIAYNPEWDWRDINSCDTSPQYGPKYTQVDLRESEFVKTNATTLGCVKEKLNQDARQVFPGVDYFSINPSDAGQVLCFKYVTTNFGDTSIPSETILHKGYFPPSECTTLRYVEQQNYAWSCNE